MSDGTAPAPRFFTVVVAVVLGATVVASASALALETGVERVDPAWPDSIESLVSFVEDEREVDIEPVPVRFLDDDAFEAAVQGETRPDEAAERQARDTTSELRALGLVARDFDLLASQRELATGGTAAYYDPTAREIVVRGSDTDGLAVDLRATLVHELTHAAQDIAGSLAATYEDDPRSLMALAVVEGDATRVQQRWIATLSARDLDALQKGTTEATAEAEKATADVPPVLTTLFEAPYSLGQAFTRAVAAERGEKGVAKLTRTAPADDVGLLDPAAYLEGRKARKVPRPKHDGGRVLDRSRMGATTLFAVLAQRLEPAVALDAADGWGGDAYISWRDRGRTCARVAFRGNTNADTTTLADALRGWVAAGPTSAGASVDARADRVTLTACEPTEKGAPVTVATADEALLLPAVRGSIQAELLEAGLGTNVAACTADRLVRAVPFSALSGDAGPIQAAAPAALAACRRPAGGTPRPLPSVRA